MPVKPGDTVREKITNDNMRNLAHKFRMAQHTVSILKDTFEIGLEAISLGGNYFKCEHRETYVHQTPTGGDIHRCRHGEVPETPFERCRDCNIERCPLTT